MAQEKEACGFYFSAHPVDRFRHISDANGAKSCGLICSQPANDDGGRSHAIMAARVEDVRWRDTKRGKRYVSATLADNSGEFQASCFDEDICKQIEELGNDGDCGLLTVELERQPGEDMPRVTIRNIQSFSFLSKRSRLVLQIDVQHASAVKAIAEILLQSKGGRCEVARKSVVMGKSVSVIVDLGGCRHITKKKNTLIYATLPINKT